MNRTFRLVWVSILMHFFAQPSFGCLQTIWQLNPKTKQANLIDKRTYRSSKCIETQKSNSNLKIEFLDQNETVKSKIQTYISLDSYSETFESKSSPKRNQLELPIYVIIKSEDINFKKVRFISLPSQDVIAESVL